MRIVLVGLSHHTAPVELRERLAVDDPEAVLAKLVACDEIDEAVLVSTCNRVEVVALTRRIEPARHRLRALLRAQFAGGGSLPEGVELDDALYEYTDSRAMQHLFRVASSLDSMVVGEPQILGQVKDAYRAAAGIGACGVILHRLFNRAFATAKRIRNETRIAEGPISVARVAVDLARQIFESLEDKSALLVGAGDTSEIALSALRDEGMRSLVVANRSRERARELAERFGASAHGLEDLPALLARADVVLASVGGREPVFGVEVVSEAMRARRGRPIFLIDIGVPRNVDPAVNDLDAVYLYDIDDLEAVAAANANERRREVTRAEAIVLDEQQRFDGWLAALKAVPTIRDLRARGEAIRRAELERALARLELSGAQREGVDALTRSIVNKLLHAPVSRLRAEVEREEGIAYLEAARVLFALDDDAAPGAEPDADEEPGDGESGTGDPQ